MRSCWCRCSARKTRAPVCSELTVDLAVRSDSYSDLDEGSTVNPKFGIDWAPLDNLKFRGTYGESFRAPTFAQIYGNSSALYVQNYSDPTRGGAITQGVTLSGGNLALAPETASTYTFGVDFVPTPDLKLNLTYFHIEYEKQITSYLSDLTILNRESQFAGTGIIVRNPDPAFIAGLVATKPIRGVLPNPVTLYVDGRTNNLGTTIASGFDLAANYEFEAGAAGKFALGLISTFFDTYEVAITPAADRVDQLNTIYNPLRLKARGNLTWSRGGWLGGLFVNYLQSYDNNLVSPIESVDAQDHGRSQSLVYLSGRRLRRRAEDRARCSQSVRRRSAVRRHRAEPEWRRRLRSDTQQSGGTHSRADHREEVVKPRDLPPR